MKRAALIGRPWRSFLCLQRSCKQRLVIESKSEEERDGRCKGSTHACQKIFSVCAFQSSNFAVLLLAACAAHHFVVIIHLSLSHQHLRTIEHGEEWFTAPSLQSTRLEMVPQLIRTLEQDKKGIQTCTHDRR